MGFEDQPEKGKAKTDSHIKTEGEELPEVNVKIPEDFGQCSTCEELEVGP